MVGGGRGVCGNVGVGGGGGIGGRGGGSPGEMGGRLGGEERMADSIVTSSTLKMRAPTPRPEPHAQAMQVTITHHRRPHARAGLIETTSAMDIRELRRGTAGSSR